MTAILGGIWFVLAIANLIEFWHTSGDSWATHLAVSLLMLVLGELHLARVRAERRDRP